MVLSSYLPVVLMETTPNKKNGTNKGKQREENKIDKLG